jgi:hypothetical protein
LKATLEATLKAMLKAMLAGCPDHAFRRVVSASDLAVFRCFPKLVFYVCAMTPNCTFTFGAVGHK